jgi:PleD family two-component response regulator
MFSSLFGKKKKKVLIIDDDVKALNTTKAMLSVNNDSFDVILALELISWLILIK